MNLILNVLFLILATCTVTNVSSDPAVDMLVKYAKKHSSRLAHEKAPLNDAIDSARYLIWRPFPHAGIGNQVLGLVSTLTLAMITDRVLLIQDEQQLFRFFDPPLDGKVQLAPQTIPINEIVSEAMKIRFNKDIGDKAQLAASFLMTHESKEEDFQALLCFDPVKDWKNVKYMVVETCQYFVPLLFANGHTREQMETLFPDRRVFSRLVSVLFRPIAHLQTRIKSVNSESKSLSSVNRVIGLQLRTFDGATSRESLDLNAQQCLEEKFPEFKEQKSLHPCLFMAALNAEHNDWFHIHDPNARIFALPNEGGQTFSDQQLESAIIDIWALGMADELIVSPYSTFGYVAAGLRETPSYLITDHGCVKQSGGEPCFHHGIEQMPKDLCPAGTSSKIQMASYLGQCPDVSAGMKLNPTL